MNKLYFVITYLQSSTSGSAQLFYDMGLNFREADSSIAVFIKTDVSQRYLFSLPNGNFRALRFDPIGGGIIEATITIADAAIVDENGMVLQAITVQQFIPVQQIKIVTTENNAMQFTVAKRANDPIFKLINVTAIQQPLDQNQQPPLIDLPQAIAKANKEAEYQAWIEHYDILTTADIQKIQAQIAAWPHRPLISVIMPTYNTPATFLRSAIESVQQQIYPYWELCIADDASTAPQVREILQEYAANESRIKLILREQNGHISASSNSALELATGEYMTLLNHDDMLAPHHLYFAVGEIINYHGTEWIYFDTDLIDTKGIRKHTHFREKPNIDLFISIAFMGTHAVYRTDKVRQLGGFRIGYEGSQDHDLGLRMLDVVEWQHIRHIPYILNYWRVHSGSITSKGELVKPYAIHAGIKAVQNYLDRHQIPATVTRNYSLPGYRVHYAVVTKRIGLYQKIRALFSRYKTKSSTPPLVSIIIPTRNRLELVTACTASIWEKTTYPNYEIIIVDNDSDDETTLEYLNYWQQEGLIRVLRYPGEFNYSAINNYAVQHANGELICLLNNDTEVITENWLTEMVSHALRPEIGIVGARLWYANNTIQHAGVFIKNSNLGHVGHGRQKSHIHYTDLTHDFSAVTGACMVMRKQVFNAVGGLNARWLPVGLNDIDLCFKVRQLGLRILYTPYSELYHHQSISRGRADPKDENNWRNYMLCSWPEMLLPDQWYRVNERHTGLRRKIKIYNPSVPKLLFLHIPKTAGVSFRSIVATEYAGDELFVFVPKLLLECYAPQGNALTLARQYVRTAKAVFSHFWFGIHHLLELERVAYITILRHPSKRTLSHYNHLMQATPPQMLQSMSITDMLRKGIIPENFMTRIISGEKLDTITWDEIDNGPFAYSANFVGFGMPPEVWRGELDSLLQRPDISPRNDPEVLKTALQNIHEHFACVGLIDNIADVVARLGQHLDWDQHSIIPELNKNRNKLITEFEATTIKVIEEYNQLDIQLYEYIQQLPNSCFLNPECIKNESRR